MPRIFGDNSRFCTLFLNVERLNLGKRKTFCKKMRIMEEMIFVIFREYQ